MELYLYDWEGYKNFAEVSFLNYKTDKVYTFIIDENQNDCDKIIEFVKGKMLVGYNSKTFDDILLNYVIINKWVTAEDIYNQMQLIIGSQRNDSMDFYKIFKPYLKNHSYKSIDLMRLLFSKKLRVSLKELECSLNHFNVEELPFPFDSILNEEQKQKCIDYNKNDCYATKLVLEKSMGALKLRRWMQKEYNVDAFSLDSVNGGIKILETLYEKEIGNNKFKKEITRREYIHLKDIILHIVKFETPEFKKVLEIYKNHTWYSSHYDEKLFKDSKLHFEPIINGFEFKFSLGGIHGTCLPNIWESNDEYEILSYDVKSYYPSMMLKWGFVPGHLDKKTFLKVFGGVKDERIVAKEIGNKLKDETLKYCINGCFGMLGNQYSWLFDHKARLQICVNGQLMLSMLVEKFFQEGILLIDLNTDGALVRVPKNKKERVKEIVEEWESITRMEMEETKFEKVWFLNTADYFGTTLKKGKIEIKEKGLFQSEVQLGKGMEFPVIAKAVKEYFLYGKDYTEFIKNHEIITDFCSYKKLNRDYECFHNGEPQQRVNRFYASNGGAYLYKRKIDKGDGKGRFGHVLKDSPVIIYNKFDNKHMKDRNINYPFYISKARELIYTIEGAKNQLTLF